MQSSLAKHQATHPMSEEHIHSLAQMAWVKQGKALIDIKDLFDGEFKSQVVRYANNKYGKGKS